LGKTILVTGAAGFIGFHLSRSLLAQGHTILGFDGLTPYYDPALKRIRLSILEQQTGFRFIEGRLEDAAALLRVMDAHRPDMVVHLAGQPGVRYSIEAPASYIEANLVGTGNLLEAIRAHPVEHLLFASTSSVYGGNARMPFAETDPADHPLSLYAATKKAGEAMVHSYAYLYAIPSTCLRFFTVYGPYGRPDMALMIFAKAMLEGRSFDVFGHGEMRRDFTYVDDLVDAMSRLLAVIPQQGRAVEGDSLSPVAPFRIVNIGGGQPTPLMDFIAALEAGLGVVPKFNMVPMQPGDVRATEADTALLRRLIGETKTTPIAEGVRHFADWFRAYHAGAGRPA